jgi:DNA-binding response OmpR family regulator
MALRGEGKTIVIADDAPEVVEMVKLVLERTGYEIIAFDNGRVALEAIPEIGPDLVLLDIIMPGMNGMEVCQAMKADPKLANIPVIMITSATQGSEVADGFWRIGAGSDDFLSKPFNPMELSARVDHLIFGTPLPPEIVHKGGGGADRYRPR